LDGSLFSRDGIHPFDVLFHTERILSQFGTFGEDSAPQRWDCKLTGKRGLNSNKPPEKMRNRSRISLNQAIKFLAAGSGWRPGRE